MEEKDDLMEKIVASASGAGLCTKVPRFTAAWLGCMIMASAA